MIIKVKDIKPDGTQLTEALSSGWLIPYFQENDEIRNFIKSPLNLNLFLQLIEDRVLINGFIETTLSPFCSRCLNGFSYPIKKEFNLMLFPKGEILKDTEDIKPKNIEELEQSCDTYLNGEINLFNIVGEQFVLALPTIFVCNDSCLGLCPICGVNKNEKKCSCKEEFVDPRLEILKNVKIKKEKRRATTKEKEIKVKSKNKKSTHCACPKKLH